MYICAADTRLFLSHDSVFSVDSARELLDPLVKKATRRRSHNVFIFFAQLYANFHLRHDDASGPTDRRLLGETTATRVENSLWRSPSPPLVRVGEPVSRVLDGARECDLCVATTSSPGISVCFLWSFGVPVDTPTLNSWSLRGSGEVVFVGKVRMKCALRMCCVDSLP